ADRAHPDPAARNLRPLRERIVLDGPEEQHQPSARRVVRSPNARKSLAAIAVVWLTTTPMATGASTASSWSLLPQPADARLARSGVVKIADGALVAVRGAESRQVQPIADRFMQLVADARGLQLHPATTADEHPAITFDVEPQASVVGE